MAPELGRIDGAPGSGKSAVAHVLGKDRSLVLPLDIESLRARLG